MGTSAGIALASVVAATSIARADDTVRLVIDQSDPTRVLLDGLLPAGKQFIAELGGLAATDQAVLVIWPGSGSCSKERTEKQHYELAMVPTTTDGKTVFRSTVPALQIRESYCLKVEIFSGLPEDVLKHLTDLATSKAAHALDGDDVKIDALQSALQQALGAVLQPELVARGYLPGTEDPRKPAVVEATANDPTKKVAPVVDALATDATNTVAITTEYKAFIDTLRDLQAQRNVRDAADAKNQKAVAGLKAAVVALPFPGSRYYFVVKDRLVSAENVWQQLADKDLKAALRPELAPQIDARLRGNSPSTKELVLWHAELSRTSGTPPKMPPLTAPPAFDVWTGTEFVAPTADALLKSATAAIAARQLAGLEAELDAAIQDANARFGKAKGKAQQAIGDDLHQLDQERAAAQRLRLTVAEYLKTSKDLQEQNDAVRATTTKRDTQRQALATRLTEAVQAAFRKVKFQLTSAGPPRSGVGRTNSIDNWVSVNVGIALAVPTFEVGAELDSTAWVLPYFGVNVHAPLERSIPPGRLIDEFWQRVCLTGGVTLTKPDALRGRDISSIVFGRPALLSVGMRVTPYSRIALGVIFYRIQENPLGGDSEVGIAPFIGYSLDLDAVKLIKDGFTGL